MTQANTQKRKPMRRLTLTEMRADVAYVTMKRRMRWVWVVLAVATLIGWVLGLVLSPNTTLSNGVVFRIIRTVAPSVDVVAKYAPVPQLAAVVYGIQWIFAPVYFGILFSFPPWSRLVQQSARTSSRLCQYGFGTKAGFLLMSALGIALLLGDSRLLPLPTFWNGLLDTPPSIYLKFVLGSNFLLSLYGALIVVIEPAILWIALSFLLNFDSMILGKHLDAPEGPKSER